MLQSDVQVSAVRFCGSVSCQGKKQAISPIQQSFANTGLENICEFSSLQDEFPARQNRESIRDKRELIPPFGPGTGKCLKTDPVAAMKHSVHAAVHD